jgi:DNA-binding SARP family transcriptional activator
MPSLPPGADGAPLAPSRRTALLLSTLSGARRGGVPLHEYLATEMLRQQTPDDRELLLAAALPDEVDPAQLAEVLGRDGEEASSGALAQLGQSGLPIRTNGGRFRLHALLRQYLRAHLERAEPGRHAALRRRWAEVTAACGEVGASLEHALAAEWWEHAVALLEAEGQRWVDAGRHSLVERAFTALPPRVVERRPRLLVLNARLAFAQGHAAAAVERARQAFFAARRQRDSYAEVRALLMEAIATLGSGRSDEALQLCLQVLEHRGVRRDKALRAEAYRLLGTVEGMRGLFPAASEHLERALVLCEELGLQWETARVLSNLGLALQQTGGAARAAECHVRALALSRELDDPVATAISLTNLAVLRFAAGRLDQAAEMLQEAVDLTQRAAQTARLAPRYVTLGDVLRAQGRPEEALRWYRAARSAGAQVFAPRWEAFALLGEAGAQLDLGSPPAAKAAAQRALEIGREGGALEISGHARATLAAVALRLGRRREASSLLEGARADARETQGKELQVRVALWSGQLAMEEKRWGEATTYVQLAADAAETLGGPTLIALEGPALGALLTLAGRHGVAPDLLSRALDTIDRRASGQVRDAASRAATDAETLPDRKMADARRVVLRVLGSFSIRVDGEEVVAGLPPGGRARELLAYLALHVEGRRRDEITADLWPDAEVGQQVTLFHTTYHRLRQALFPELLLTPTAGSASSAGYRLNPALLDDVDVRRFEAALRAGAGSGIAPDQRRTRLAEAVEAYGGAFFVECYADWAEDTRRRLERAYAGALAQLVELAWGAEDYHACLAWCGLLLRIDQYDDAVHARVLECYERLNEPLAGILHYRRALGGTQPDSGPPGAPTTLRPSRRRLEETYRRLIERSGS